jgi:hypothetical protein
MNRSANEPKEIFEDITPTLLAASRWNDNATRLRSDPGNEITVEIAENQHAIDATVVK